MPVGTTNGNGTGRNDVVLFFSRTSRRKDEKMNTKRKKKNSISQIWGLKAISNTAVCVVSYRTEPYQNSSTMGTGSWRRMRAVAPPAGYDLGQSLGRDISCLRLQFVWSETHMVRLMDIVCLLTRPMLRPTEVLSQCLGGVSAAPASLDSCSHTRIREQHTKQAYEAGCMIARSITEYQPNFASSCVRAAWEISHAPASLADWPPREIGGPWIAGWAPPQSSSSARGPYSEPRTLQ